MLPFKHFRSSLVRKLILTLGVLLFFSLSTSMYIAIHFQEVPTTLVLAVCIFLIAFALMVWLVFGFIKRPIHRLIGDIRRMKKGEYPDAVDIDQNDEVGQLTAAVYQMGKELGEKQASLNKQRDEYQALFELVPCLITVQDRNYKLLKYNREFFEMFDPNPGDYCFQAYKGRDIRCENCPVEKTFEDGMSHYSEETGINKDGTTTYWILKTTPIKNNNDEVVAAMEMSLDVTPSRQLEEKLKQSEKRYQTIFNNIPNPVFLLDLDTFNILDCNHSVSTVYGYTKDDIINRSFLDLFSEEDKKDQAAKLRSATVINQAKHLNKEGRMIYVDIWVSPYEYAEKKVLLVATSDITQRLETEQQLIQASKMATLGEMASGIAHELNQPLSVIKTGSSFCMKKFNENKEIDDDTILNIIGKIDTNVDRATKITNHMRQIARKSDMSLERIQLNDVLKSASEIFNQQLKVRGIDVIWDLQEDLPIIEGDWGRLEQVITNLVLNARDAIEEKWGEKNQPHSEKKITLKTRETEDRVMVEVCDTGTGMPNGLTDKIFDPFFTTKEVGKGTGLGLSISYGFVKDCKGNIRVAPNPGGGACFAIAFPKVGGDDGKDGLTRR